MSQQPRVFMRDHTGINFWLQQAQKHDFKENLDFLYIFEWFSPHFSISYINHKWCFQKHLQFRHVWIWEERWTELAQELVKHLSCLGFTSRSQHYLFCSLSFFRIQSYQLIFWFCTIFLIYFSFCYPFALDLRNFSFFDLFIFCIFLSFSISVERSRSNFNNFAAV